MPTLSDLLADSGAIYEIVVVGTYLDATDTPVTVYFSRSGWTDPPTSTYGAYIPPLLDISLHVSQSVDVLNPSTLLEGAYSEIRLINNSIYTEYAGLFDGWYRFSVDQQLWYVYLVGVLSDGTRVELSDVINTPLYTLVGINIPEVSSSECVIHTRSQSEILNTPLQPVTYSPPCLLFPGTSTGTVDLGDNLDITGVQSLSFWVYLTDPVSTTQYLVWKDGTTTGYYLAVGLVGAGTVAAGVEIVVRGQSPDTTTTAANVIRAYQWYRIDVSIDATTRRIDIDGTTAVTTTSITGTPTGNSVSLVIGKSLLGRIHRALWWSDARSNATMSAEGRTPITGAESNLREAFLFGEGSGLSTVSAKSGSSLTGTIHASVLWDTATWNYGAILGQHEPYVLGTVPRVPVSWIDPPKQIGQVSRGAIALLSELQSNHGAVSSSNYTVDLTNGTFKVTSGALSGTYSASVTANNLWDAALLFNGTSSRATAAVTMPAASKYIGVHIRVDNTANSNRQIAGWNGSTSILILRMNAIGTNILSAIAANDAGTVFTASCPFALEPGRRYSVLASLDTVNPSTNGLQLYVDSVLVVSVPITGAWTGTQTTLSIGHRSTVVDLWFPGVIDEIVVGNVAGTAAIALAHHITPSTSSLTGIIAGWHCNGTNTPFAGAVSLTLTSTTYTSGRCSAEDLARKIMYIKGYTDSDLDAATWLSALNDNPSDCGWFVSGGQKGVDVLDIVLGGLGFILHEVFGVFKIKRFEGLSGTATKTFNPDVDSVSEDVVAQSSNPSVYQWIIEYATNNTVQDPANIAGSLATTDPDRYSYGSKAALSVTKTDGATLDRFPGAISMVRRTALVNLRDAETEALRLIPVHKDGADIKSVALFLSLGDVDILEEIGPLQAETDLDTGTFVVIGIEIDEESGRLVVWRPAT